MSLIKDILMQQAYLDYLEREINGFKASDEPRERTWAECIRVSLEAADKRIFGTERMAG
ncbi:MAG: hypothetical protein AABM67_09035 [Acidobacteriota bacterium]